MEIDKLKRAEPVESQADEETSDLDLMILLVDLYKGLKKFWWLVLVLSLIGAGLTLYRSVRVYTPMYRADATFTIATRSTTNYGSDDYAFSYSYGTVTQMARTFSYILSSDILQQIIIEDLGVTSLNGSITATGLEDTNLFILSVISADQQNAYDILQSAIRNYPRVAEFIIGDTRLNMLADPSVSQMPINQVSYPRTLLRGFIIGMMAGLAFVLLYALLRRTIRKMDDIQKKLNQKSFGVLPHVIFKRRMDKSKQQLIVLNRQVSGAYKEAIRSLRSRVIKAMEAQGTKVLMVTSTLPSEGKSTVALNLALSIAQKGARVALLDADLRHQNIHNLLGLQDLPYTLEHVIRGDVTLKNARYEVFVKGFCFVPSGANRDNAVETLRSPGFLQAVDALKAEMDYVIIDTPPCGMLSDASALAGVSDSLLYVIRQDTANISQIIDGLQNIGYSGIRILGCVLNDASAGFEGYGYGYGYGYGSRYAYGYGSGYTYGNYGSYGEGEQHGDEALEEHEVS